MNDAYKKLRNPLPQILGVFSILFSFPGFVQYFYSLTIESTPMYLIVSSILIIVVSMSCFVVLFLQYAKIYELLIKSDFKLLSLYILASYCVVISLYIDYVFMSVDICAGFNFF
ncbi:DUF5079 family protein, partial [Staphylococcus simulans]